MAEIKARGKDKWLVRVFLGRKDGRTQYYNRVVTGLKKDAIAHGRAIETKRDLGLLTPAEGLTLSKFLDKWLKDVKANELRPRTLDGYKDILDRYVIPVLGEEFLSDITPTIVQRFYNQMADEEYSGRTIQYAHSILNQALKHAVWLEYIPKNPAEFTTRPQAIRGDIEVLDPGQAKEFIGALEHDRHYAIFLLALSMGMRPSEYTALKWPDFNFTANTVTINKTLVFPTGEKWYLGEPKTKNAWRTLDLPATLSTALQSHKRKQAEVRLKKGSLWQNHDFVFCTRYGTPFSQWNLNRDLRLVLDGAGITQKFTIYCLRHTYATLALAKGIDAKIVSANLGHASVAFTQDTYQHVLQSMRKDAAETIESLLFG